MKNDDKEILKRIIQYCDDVCALLSEYGNDFELYKSKISFQYSCNMCIIQIGELVGRLSDEFVEQHSEVPWHAIKAMRNLHAHDYDRVDFSIVWDTLTKEIPELKETIEKMC